MVLMNCSQPSERCRQLAGAAERAGRSMDLRLYGIGAQILRDLGVGRMRLMAAPRKMPSMAGFGLEVTGLRCETAPSCPKAAAHAPGHRRSRFNEEICGKLLDARARRSAQAQAPSARVVSVPGALEIPLALQWLAQSGRFDALVALGAVIRGDTYHFEVVANESARGVMDVMLECGVPVANGILTTDDEAQAEARLDKGAEAVRVALEMARLRSNWRAMAMKTLRRAARAKSRCRRSTPGSSPAATRSQRGARERGLRERREVRSTTWCAA